LLIFGGINRLIRIFSKGTSVDEEEQEFLKVLESRAAGNEGKIEVVDINKKKSVVEVKELLTLASVVEEVKKDFPGLVSPRIFKQVSYTPCIKK
jgi:hypothetical protein